MARGERFATVDPGVNGVRLLLGRVDTGGVEVLEQRRIGTAGAGSALPPGEIRDELNAALEGWDSPPVCLCVPQRVTMSLVVDLPGRDRSAIRRSIETEIAKLSGLNESQLAFDFVRMTPFGKHEAPYWVTFCQEDDLREQATRLGLELDDVCEVTTSGNALLAAGRIGAEAADEDTVFVYLGGGDTVITIQHGGQGVYAGAIPIGLDSFSDAIMSATGGTGEQAEKTRVATNLLDGGEALPALQTTVDAWRREIERTITEWRQENGMGGAVLGVRLFSVGAPMPGLLARLNSEGALAWRMERGGEVEPEFQIAHGAGAIAAGRDSQAASLMPREAREAWRRMLGVRRFQWVNVGVLFVTLVLLVFGSLEKNAGIRARKTLLAEQREKLDRARRARTLERESALRYNALRPALERQRRSLDTLEALAALEATSVDSGVWYALFADTETYVSMPEIVVTNQTNTVTAPEPPVGDTGTEARKGATGEDLEGARGFIAVATVPGENENVGTIVGRLVDDLNRNSLFEHVDLLSSDRRRRLVDPAVVVPDRHYVFSMRLAENVFGRPLAPEESEDVDEDGIPQDRGAADSKWSVADGKEEP